MMSPLFRDRLGSLLMLAFIAALWVQRDYMSPFGGMFPDTIMILMAAFVVLTLILSFTRYAAMPNPSEKQDADATELPAHTARQVTTVIILLALWVGLYRTAGFALTGTLGFAAIAWYLGDRGATGVLKAVGFGALISFVIYMVFDYFLLVPLPPGFLFN